MQDHWLSIPHCPKGLDIDTEEPSPCVSLVSPSPCVSCVLLVYWLERRCHFAVFISIGWALLPWGVPFYLPIISYIAFVFLFLPIRIHDIRRIGGHYRSFLLLPGIIAGVLFVWVLFHYSDWIYLWHMVRP